MSLPSLPPLGPPNLFNGDSGPGGQNDYAQWWPMRPYLRNMLVTNYNPLFYGTVQNATAINAAILDASIGGGEVHIPAGFWTIDSTVILPTGLAVGLTIRGDGANATVLRAKNGLNADVINAGATNAALINLGAAFATSPTNGGAQNFTLANLTIDGNKAGQTSGPAYCFRAYCNSFLMSGLTIKNGFSGGILTDWNGNNIPTNSDSADAIIQNVRIHDCNGMGLEMGGPHDSKVIDVTTYLNGSHGVHLAPNTLGMLFTRVHSWGPGLGVSAVPMLLETSFSYFSQCEAEGSDSVQVVLLGSGNEWIGSAGYGAVAPAGGFNVVGMQLGQTAGGTPIPGSIFQSGGVKTAIQATSNYIESRFSNCQLGGVGFTNTANNHINIRTVQASGPSYAGSPAITDILMLGTTSNDKDAFLTGALAVGMATSAPAITNGWTIGSGGLVIFRAAPAGAVTGVIIQNGVIAGQMLTIINESVGANTITMAAAGTSHVADGVACIIAGLTQKTFLWDSVTALWYHS